MSEATTTATSAGGDYIEGEPPRRPRRGWAAVGVALALVAGAVAVGVANRGGGEDTPEGAVRRLAEAIADEDLLGVLDALVPAERDVLGPRVVKLFSELGRIGLLDDGLDLSRVPGGDLTVEGLQLQSEPLRDGMASVLITGGTAALNVTAGALPLGSVTRPLLEAAGAEPTSPPSTDLAESETRLVAVRDDGRWYVSLGWSVADESRRDNGEPFPDPSEGVTPKGEVSAEAAVEAMVRAGADGNFRRMVELTTPGESAALHAFAPLALPPETEAVGEVERLALTTEASDGEAKVRFTDLRVNLGDVTIEKDDECVRYRFDVPDDVSLDSDVVPPDYLRPCIIGELVVTTVERDGAWYVSPAGTVLDSVLASLAGVTREEVEQAVEEHGPEGLLIVLDRINFGFFGVGLAGGFDDDGASESVCASSGGGPDECELQLIPAPVPAPLPTLPGELPPPGVPDTTPGTGGTP